MRWPELLVMVRHAESEGNVVRVEDRPKLDKGAQLYELTERGQTQARITGEYVREHFAPFDIKYTSYYTRARQTMKHLLPPDEKWYEDSRLAEAQRGIWHTMTHDEIKQYYPGEFLRKEREGLYHYRPPGGENWPDIEERAHSFLGTLSRDCVGKRVLIVVHGHWQIMCDSRLEHFPIEEMLRRYKEQISDNASITIYKGGERLACMERNIVPWKGRV